MQECIQDTEPAVVALGLASLQRLCETDLLDFYKAWKVHQSVMMLMLQQDCPFPHVLATNWHARCLHADAIAIPALCR